MKSAIHLLFLASIIIFSINSCSKNDDYVNNCPPFENIQESPFKEPIWHPTDKIIGFNHTPLRAINYSYGIDCPQQASYEYEEEMKGFYLIDEDGKNQRRILPYELNTPAWSPNGKWIAFSKDAQIFIMPFNGVDFDTSATVQLTFEGRNFFPAWSPDGELIAFDSNNNSPTGLYFIWKMKKDGSEKIRIAFTPDQGEARMPFWGNDFDLVYQQYTDTSAEIFSMDSSGNSKTRLTSNNDRDFLPRYAPNNQLIGFISQSHKFGSVELWTINLSTNKKLKLTSEGCQDFSWSPEGKIVYINYDYSRLNDEKGTLWIMNSDGSEKQQLTFNNLIITQ